jgi:hypothetical protein
MNSVNIRGIYNSITDNNLSDFKKAIHEYDKPLNSIYINITEKSTILHFLGKSLSFYKMILVKRIPFNPKAINNRYDMMKYLFDIFEIYFMKNTEEMSQRSSFIKENISCPNVKNQNLIFKDSDNGTFQMLESNPTQDLIRIDEDDGYVNFEKMQGR